MNKFLFNNALKFRISRHIVFFIIVTLVFTFVLYSRNSEHCFLFQLRLTFINAIIFLGYGYLTIFILIPFILLKKKYLLFGVSFISLGLVLSAIKLSISDFIFYSAISPEFVGSMGLLGIRLMLTNTKDMSFIVALFVIARFSKDWLVAEKQHKILLGKYDELNLRLLQSHFEPHFLFNTLNNLYALSLNNLNETIEMIGRFKRVMQFAIVEAQSYKVPLHKEISLIQDYALIEQIRYGSRLRIGISIIGEVKQQMIAPFLLFTLVENCFIHGSSPDAGQPWIELTLNCEKSSLYFEAKNSIPRKTQVIQIEEYKELINLRKRLNLIYPRKYTLTAQHQKQVYTVKLDLEL